MSARSTEATLDPPDVEVEGAWSVVAPPTGGIRTAPGQFLRKAPDGQLLPTVEIFPTQLDVIFNQGQLFTYKLKGACYDRNFAGRLVIESAAPQSCNVLLGGPRLEWFNASFTGNAEFEIPVTLFSAQNTGLQFLTCSLRYSAFHRYFLNGVPVEENVARTNTVTFKYRARRP